MRIALDLLSYAVAGLRSVGCPAHRVCDLPPRGIHPRRPRLPGLAVDLARRALEGRGQPAPSAVFFGTGLGCLTETEAFVENLFLQGEATPMPRAFSGSVHNAAASRIAIEFKVRGESQTFVHGETSFAQALFAAGVWSTGGAGEGSCLVGGADEYTPYVERGRCECGCAVAETEAEGGAVFLCARGPSRYRPIARVSGIFLGRCDDMVTWLHRRAGEHLADVLLLAGPTGGHPVCLPALPFVSGAIPCKEWTGDHPSSASNATAIAAGVISGEIDPSLLSLRGAPRTIGVLTASRFRDVALVIVEKAA